MVMFYHAEGCRCGHCHAAPPAGAYPEGPDYDPEDGPLPSDSPCACAQVGTCGCGLTGGKFCGANDAATAAPAGPPARSGATPPTVAPGSHRMPTGRPGRLRGERRPHRPASGPCWKPTPWPRGQPGVGRANAGGPRRQSRKGGIKVLMRVTYDGPDFGLGKLNNKRAFNCLSVLADLGLLKVDEDTGMGWAELSIAVEELLVLVPQARKNIPRGRVYDASRCVLRRSPWPGPGPPLRDLGRPLRCGQRGLAGRRAGARRPAAHPG